MFKIKIDTGNDAFYNNREEEIIRIMQEDIIPQLKRGVNSSTIHDINGNKVGEFKFIDEE